MAVSFLPRVVQTALADMGRKVAKGGKTAKGPAKPPVKKGASKGTKRIIIEMKGKVIEGRIHKPSAFYILTRSNLVGFQLQMPLRTFTSKILDAVRGKPF